MPSPTPNNYAINTALEETWISFYEELKHQINQTPNHILPPSEPEYLTDAMAPKKSTENTRSIASKLKQLEKSSTPLDSRLHNIRNAKVVEQQWKRV